MPLRLGISVVRTASSKSFCLPIALLRCEDIREQYQVANDRGYQSHRLYVSFSLITSALIRPLS